MIPLGVRHFSLRLREILEWGFLLLIPTQLGKHFWQPWSYVLGIRSDYLVPILYLVDVVWILWWILNLVLNKKEKGSEFNFGVIAVMMFLVVNTIMASDRMVAVYWWTRWIQWWWTLKIISERRVEVMEKLRWVIPIWIMGESLLGLAEVVNQGSIQGVFYWLGERRFSLTTVGIAQMSVAGEGVLRAYGTFSHPNSLAGFLLLSLCLWLAANKNRSNNWIKWVVIWGAGMGIILAGSRTIWLTTLVLMGWWLWRKKLSVVTYLGILMMVTVGTGLVVSQIVRDYPIGEFLGGWDKQSYEKRLMLNVSAIKMAGNYPLFGVGAGNFVAKLPDYKTGGIFWSQPVHNLLLLVLTEVGILGMAMCGWLIASLFKGKIKSWRWVGAMLTVVLITGSVDHYWVTLPQTRWLLAIVLGVMAR